MTMTDQHVVASGSRSLRIGVLGAGGRGGEAYGGWFVRHPQRARVAAVADPRAARRDALGDRAGVPAEARFEDWRELLASSSALEVDAVVVSLPDHQHVEPTVAAAELGLGVLLEKPVAPTEGELERVAEAARRTRARIGVAHVLRSTPFWSAVHALVGDPAMGRMLTIRHEENIGFWHFAHSYVRGNWKNAATSSPMVLAKTCHDLDLIRWLAGSPPQRISSMGSLELFRPENAPAGAPARCTDGCPVAESCAFYAPRYYVDALREVHGRPVVVLSDDTSTEGRMAALREGPYGLCVYRAGNDVVDHQQTLMEFPDGLTATLSTSALTSANTRTVQITCAGGELTGRMDTGRISLALFSPTAELGEVPDGLREVSRSRTGPLQHRVIEFQAGPSIEDVGHNGHPGGDDAYAERFIAALAAGTLERDPDLSLETALDSHRMAFAAERSRISGQTVTMG